MRVTVGGALRRRPSSFLGGDARPVRGARAGRIRSRRWVNRKEVLHTSTYLRLTDGLRSTVNGTPVPYLTVSVPTMPASRWPGTSQKYVYFLPASSVALNDEVPDL